MNSVKTILAVLRNYLIFLVYLIFILSSCTKYVEYVPVVLIVERGDHKLIEYPNLITTDHIEAIKIILEKYDEQYKMKNGKLYILQTLQNDKDLLQNYTSKAEVFRKNNNKN